MRARSSQVCVSLCFSLAFCLTSLFHSLFFSLSLSLSISLLFCSVLPSFFSFFFAAFFFAFFCFLVFVSSLICLVSLLLFHEQNNIKTLNYILLFFNPVCFGGFLFCFVFQIPFPYLCFFPHVELCFLFNINVLFFQKKRLVQKTSFGQEGGCNRTLFVNNLCFAKCEKLSFWGGHFRQIWLMFKKHSKFRYFCAFLKQTKAPQKNLFEGLLSGPSRGLLSGPSRGLLSGPSCCFFFF